MKWSRSVFSAHYKEIRVVGSEPERILNLCIIKNIEIRKVKLKSDSELCMCISARDLNALMDHAGSRYNITVCKEDGFLFKLLSITGNKTILAGFLIFIMIIIFQSLFISEIEISGYEGISEQSLRKTMKEVGFYEGCRKSIDLNKVKLHLYDKYDNISWVGIKFDGNLAHVTISETDMNYKKTTVSENTPCNIVADKSGYVNSIDPEVGLRTVNDGTYIREGDILISGIIPLQKTSYDEKSQMETEQYVHAAGTIEAKIPVRLNYYRVAFETKKEKTGKKWVTIAFNGNELAGESCPYETSVVRRITFLNLVKPIKVNIQLNYIEEVTVSKSEITKKQTKKEVLNEIQKYVKENLPDNAQILNKSLNFTREKNIMYIGITLETLQKIGIEEEIIVDKSNR